VTFAEEWRRIAARIHGFRAACELFASFQSARQGDSNGQAKSLREQSGKLIGLIDLFGQTHVDQLPPSSLETLRAFVLRAKPFAAEKVSTSDSVLEALKAAALLVVAFESELTFLLNDEQQVLRRLSERAFVHLQRQIVADEEVRAKWKKALVAGEVACERFGSVHLLSHGLFPFKIDGLGARTDLMIPDKSIGAEVAGFAEGLVLTEWKVAKPDTQAEAKFHEAKKQADLYAIGALAGLELSECRYLVVVSEKAVKVPPDLREERWIYRHINIAVDPDTPSITSKKRNGRASELPSAELSSATLLNTCE